MWLFVACVHSHDPADDSSGPADDSSGTSLDDSGLDDSGDTETVPLPEGLKACDGGKDPFVFESAEDVSAAWGLRPNFDVLNLIMNLADKAASATGCPVVTEKFCGKTWWTGGCAADSVEASGSAERVACVDGGSTSWDKFAVADKSAGWSFAIDGEFGAAVAGMLLATMDVTMSDSGVCDDVVCSGIFQWTLDFSGYSDDASTTATAHVEPTEGPGGDFCLDEDVVSVKGCDAEGVGWTVLRGSSDAMVVWDGGASCDGCGDLYIDGHAAGEWCRSSGWAAY